MDATQLFERCEVVFPVKDKAAKARLREEILPAYLADTAKARLMQEDGRYVRASEGQKTRGFSAQEFLMRLAEGKADLDAIPKSGRIVHATEPAPDAAEPAVAEK